MPSVSVSIGPVPSWSVRAWLDAATVTMTVLHDRPDLGMPADVLEAFEGYLALWSRHARSADVFEWDGSIDSSLLRRLASHWVRLAALARDDPEGSGLRVGGPESEPFFAALAAAMAKALAEADDQERFAPKFEEVVPEFAPASTSGTGNGPSGRGGPTAVQARRVLLVDDNPDIRLLVRIGLESDGGFTVMGEACDGREAVDAVAQACPDVVLLDLAMPVMDGFEALPLMKQLCPRTRVVIYSASDSPSTRERIRSAGGDAYLRKDAGIADVVDALRLA